MCVRACWFPVVWQEWAEAGLVGAGLDEERRGRARYRIRLLFTIYTILP